MTLWGDSSQDQEFKHVTLWGSVLIHSNHHTVQPSIIHSATHFFFIHLLGSLFIHSFNLVGVCDVPGTVPGSVDIRE